MVELNIWGQPGRIKVIMLCLVCSLFVKGFFCVSKSVFGKHPPRPILTILSQRKNKCLPNKAYIYMKKNP